MLFKAAREIAGVGKSAEGCQLRNFNILFGTERFFGKFKPQYLYVYHWGKTRNRLKPTAKIRLVIPEAAA